MPKMLEKIKELFLNNMFSDPDNQPDYVTTEYIEACNKIDEIKEQIKTFLPADKQNLIEELDEEYTGKECIAIDEFYKHGFDQGLKLKQEIKKIG